jgi:glucosamine--fructose-6-phosphate aminotransferase (isomerizing)
MKHGPIALIDDRMPVVVIAIRDSVYDKVIANIEEVKSRRGDLILIGNEGDNKLSEFSENVILVPETVDFLSPILTVIPLQLLAYHIAAIRGCDIDQPRNLAKSVTVE